MVGSSGDANKKYAGIGVDGSNFLRGRVEMDMRSVGTGGDATKIPSSCTTLARWRSLISLTT